MEKNRCLWIDGAKGIGIILVILGHCMRDEMRFNYHLYDMVFKFIYTFHMPLFFFLSGFLFLNSYRKNPEKFILKKIKRLLIPFVSFSGFIYLFFWGVNLLPPVEKMLSGSSMELRGLGEYLLLCLNAENPYAYHLWYLWVLFLITVIFYFLKRFLDLFLSEQNSILALTVIAIAMHYIRYYIQTPTLVSFILSDSIFFVLGLCLCYRPKLLDQKIIFNGIIIISTLLIIWRLYTDKHILKLIEWKPLGIFVDMFMVFGLILITVQAARMTKGQRILPFLGRNSFVIYLLHQPLCCAFVGLVLYNKLKFPPFPVCAICFALSIIVPLAILWCVRKVPVLRKAFKMFLTIE